MAVVMSRLCSLLLLVLLAACSTTEVDSTATQVSAKTVLLLPVDAMYPELAEAALPAYGALQRALEKKRFHVITSNRAVFDAAVDQALEAAGAMYDPAIGKFLPADRNIYLKTLIDVYALSHDYDVVIMPSLVIHAAAVDGDTALWDGVRRPIEQVAAPQVPYRHPSTMRGLSLQLAAYTRNGLFVVQSDGGLSLPYRMDYRQVPPLFVLKDELFTAAELREAVTVSLKTVLQQVKYHD